MDPTYRTALVTGASSGIGRELASWLAKRGTRVWAAARRVDKLRELAASLPEGRIVPLELDVGEADAAHAAISRLDEENELDLVVANAGLGGESRIEGPWQPLHRMIAVNVTGAAATLMAVAPGMVKRRRGHLVGVASVAAFRGLPRHSGYSASKAFVSTFLECLRLDLAGTPVKVTGIYPGFVKSELTAKNKFDMPFLMDTEVAVEKIGRAILAGKRTFVFPWQMAVLMAVARAVPDPLWDFVIPRLTRRAGLGSP